MLPKSADSPNSPEEYIEEDQATKQPDRPNHLEELIEDDQTKQQPEQPSDADKELIAAQDTEPVIQHDQTTTQPDRPNDPGEESITEQEIGPNNDEHSQDQSSEAQPVETKSELVPSEPIVVQDDPPTFDLTNGISIDEPQQGWSTEPNAEEQELVPDDIDSDSALGSDTESMTTGLAESIWQFRMEHGRTYHAYKDGKYIFPNDEREADRLDMQHHLLRMTYGNKLFFSPLSNPKRCVDVGTGTGIWAIDFADEFPECQVLGIDLSPCQPTLVPPNLKFIVDDAEDLWIYEQKFDFIRLGLMAGCFADWPKFFRQAYENLEPGGWLELQDYGLPVRSFDGTHIDTDVYRWGELLCEAGRKLGRPLGTDCSDNYSTWMRDAGFVDIHQLMYMWPTSGWPKDPFMKDIGRWNQVNILDGLEGFCLALLTRGLGWNKVEVDVFVAKVSRDLKDKRIHAYFPMPVVFGRKPFPGEVAFL